jgi:RNA polymerase-interacting CarD/CdnL/TRCF family regulator
MQFKVDDAVVHPFYGVGHITAIEEKQFSEIDAGQYYQIAFPKSNIWLPVEAQATIGLRLVTAREDLDKYRALIKSRPVLLSSNLPKQYGELTKRLKKGSFQTMCEVVRDLTALGWKKPLGATAKATLRKTQQRLYQEWATAADIPVAQAAKEIDTLLQATQEKAMK